MDTEITAWTDIAVRMQEFSCAYPETGIALLPVNFATASLPTDLLQASDSATVRKLLKEADILVNDIFVSERRPMYIKNKSADWAGPIILIGAAFYSQNPMAVSLALNVIGNYVTEFLRGSGRGRGSVTLDIVVETKGKSSFKKISYRGPADGIPALDSVIRRVFDD